jgi:hypothetical protein
VELFHPRLAFAGPVREIDNFRGCGYSRQVKACHQSLFQYPHAYIDEGVVEEVVLPEERHRRVVPRVHR